MLLNDEVDERELVVPAATQNETDLILPDLRDKGPYYVMRILGGAKIVEIPGQDKAIVRYEGTEYFIRKEHLDVFRRIAEKIRREELEPRGIVPPYTHESMIRIHHDAAQELDHEQTYTPDKLRVFFMLRDNGGCGFYRVIQPVQFMQHLKDSPIHAEYAPWFTYRTGKFYDMIVAPRLGQPVRIGAMINLADAGKLLVYETDDLLSDIPDWNPNRNEQTDTDNFFREYLIRHAHGIIVSTPELKEMVGRPDITSVCYNGINPHSWPMAPRPKRHDQVHFLWAGSSTHSKDLELLIQPVMRLIKKFGERFKITFVNYIPDEFSVAYGTGQRLKRGVAPKFQANIAFMPGCPVFQWPKHLAAIDSDVFIAPLAPCKFNESKSELKVIEGWALGNAVLASDIAPYKRAVQHGHDGLLVGDNPDLWYNAMRDMVEDAESRRRMSENGVASLKARYTMDHVIEQYERAILGMARGKVGRPECEAAIEKRMKEKGWA